MKIKSTHSNQLNSSLNLPNFTMYLVNTPNGLMVQWSDLYKSRLNLMVPVVFWHPSGLYFQSGFFHWIYSDPPGGSGSPLGGLRHLALHAEDREESGGPGMELGMARIWCFFFFVGCSNMEDQ